ncbi:cation-transporting P-type ATPase [Cellulophaga sp. Hel_I_12]|uniref:cation-translocating P-type ATPase n=1 Tax=Cellulophaga sp. Hel_I_12 TaxID=1249972 RepID=UPI0006470D12|nr:cation-transporting P-type ATPase [Cellulophaga sp. Hel_I_12]
MIKNAFSIQIFAVVEQLKSSLENGLTIENAEKYLHVYGENQVPEHRPKKRAKILLDQFIDPIIWILIIAAFLSFIFLNWLEGIAILVAVLISIAIGFFMEFQAIRSLETLRKMGQATAKVKRSGKIIIVKASELVVGDLMLLESGDIISADARLFEVDNLSVKESALTGESLPIFKKTGVLPDNTPITHQSNMVFKGTMIITGFAKAIVTATGKYSQLGNIQQMGIDALQQITPLEKKLNNLSKRLVWFTLVMVLLIVITGYLQGKNLLFMIETGVALAVAAIPEGLLIVSTIALSQGMLRLSKRQVIIKKLEAVETLGATNIICTDKTGTLTEDLMEVHSVISADNFDLNKTFQNDLQFEKSKYTKTFEMLLLAGVLCNNVKYDFQEIHGDAIEVALLKYAKQIGYQIESFRKLYPEMLELPFDANRKLMATAHYKDKSFAVFSKGAFESLINHCDTILEEGKIKVFDDTQIWENKVEELASQGMRTLAFAYKEVVDAPTIDNILYGLTFLGIIGFIDPARKDVKATINVYKNAGIKVVMMTGDHPATSKKIAEEIGLLQPTSLNDAVIHGKALHGIENFGLNDNDKLLKASVFARVTPEQKLALVSFYQKNNYIVGMIGDGINDVPALRKADIGIAMGIRGTGAAREAADVILKNDTFTAIELAIHQGRVVFQNIRQFVVFLISCNFAEILSVGMAALLNLPSPLLPLQILFLNLVTDTFPALALGLGKGSKNIMKEPARNPKEAIMTKDDWFFTVLYGICITSAVLGMVIYSDMVLGLPSKKINNMAFFTLVFAQLLNVFNIPKQKLLFSKNEVTTNLWIWGALIVSLVFTFSAYFIIPIAKALGLEPLKFSEIVLTLLFALGAIFAAQIIKYISLCIGKSKTSI